MTVFNASTFQLLMRKAAGGYGYLFGVDAVAKILAVSNLIDIALSDSAPGDITQLWLDPDAVTPAAGTYKVWDTASTTWVPLTFARFAAWLVGRSGITPTPTGAVLTYAGAAAPTGWLLCNGAAVSRATYAALFAITGVTYGVGNGTTTFNVPDLRGEFVRGLDIMGTARGVDTGRTLGSAQSDQNKTHTHTGMAQSAGAHDHALPMGTSGGGPGGDRVCASLGTAVVPVSTDSVGAHTHALDIDAAGGAEARPRSVALTYIIKT